MEERDWLPEPALDRPFRRTGRARVAVRAAPLADNLRPVGPGLPGGQYNPLTEARCAAHPRAALDALEQIGLSQGPALGRGDPDRSRRDPGR